MKRNRNRARKYMCVGENFRDNAPIGDCGRTKTLMQWLVYLSHKSEEYLSEYFDDSYTNADVVKYIYSSWGKRLEESEG